MTLTICSKSSSETLAAHIMQLFDIQLQLICHDAERPYPPSDSCVMRHLWCRYAGKEQEWLDRVEGPPA
eukprot:COSAG05_NODE_2589_length_2868_cov_1.239075_5_plen_69_part_00